MSYHDQVLSYLGFTNPEFMLLLFAIHHENIWLYFINYSIKLWLYYIVLILLITYFVKQSEIKIIEQLYYSTMIFNNIVINFVNNIVN